MICGGFFAIAAGCGQALWFWGAGLPAGRRL